MRYNMADFRDIWNNRTDWTKYNEANGTSGTPEMPQICINEYAEPEYCGVPGRLVNWISRLEDEKITGCLPFWHQANNLNDLAAGANEGNGAWWLYQWYGNMSGTTQPVSSTTSYELLYGVSTIDEAKKVSTTLLGGYTGDITVKLNNISETETFRNAAYVNVNVQETVYTGFHGAANKTPTILTGVYPVAEDGSVTLTISGALFESAYNVTVTQASEADLAMAGMAIVGSSGDVYEAELAALSGTAVASAANTNPPYYLSGSGNRAVDMPAGATMTYTIKAPTDGKYKLEFLYGNGQGSERNNMNTHNPVNVVQTFSLDGGTAEQVIMESTLFQSMCGIKTMYYDLTAGEHTVSVTTESAVNPGMVYHDFVRVTYAGVYGQPVPAFNTVYEAELADFNKLLNNPDSTVTTETEISGYSGGGYVKGLSARSVSKGGGIRYIVVVEESGLYNLSLQYASDATGNANIYVGNTATTLNRINKTVALTAGEGWQSVTASVYLQKGINVVDVDATVDIALDYLRVRSLDEQINSTTIEAEAAIPAEMEGKIEVAESAGASGGKYVVGMKGAYAGANYLEFTYNAASDGKYQMQVFHSNEDLAGSHAYNIKTTDKYAVFEVNGTSGSPKFTLIGDGAGNKPVYFVDCGDHNPDTVSEGDLLGTHNSVTDQLYAADAKTKYFWGIVLEENGEQNLGWQGGSMVQSASDKAVYTTYQRALSNSQTDLTDGKAKTETFRYAHGQDALSARYVSYKFELEPGTYDVTVCMGNTWNNAGSPKVTLTADGVNSVEQSYQIGDNTHATKTMRINLTTAEKNSSGRVELGIKAASSDPTIQMNYILINEASDKPVPQTITLPGGIEADDSKIPNSVYLGKLTAETPWMVDYRNLKNETDRYFFINTFSDDTFREKTITLNLQQGVNTIRIYNDNSWNVTYGGSKSTPATTWVKNYTPNFDKFIITPMALNTPVKQAAAYTVSVLSGEGGTAVANCVSVAEGGSYQLTVTPDAVSAAKIYINGVAQTGLVQDGKNYILTVSNVATDQNVQVFFVTGRENLKSLYEEYKKLDGKQYSTNSWLNAWQAGENAKAVLEKELPTDADITNAYRALQTALDNLVLRDQHVVYFVDCGDHDPSTITGNNDSFGNNNSVTDQHYGVDSITGYSWGVVPLDDNDKVLTSEEGCKTTWNQNDKGVYTTYQRPLSNSVTDLNDGQGKTATFRYADAQDTSGYSPRRVQYRFELEPGQYEVTVGMGNTWGNAGHPTVTLSADSVDNVSEQYSLGTRANEAKTMTIDLTNADKNENDKVELSVRATSNDPTIQMNYILIKESGPVHNHTWSDTWSYDEDTHWHACSGCKERKGKILLRMIGMRMMLQKNPRKAPKEKKRSPARSAAKQEQLSFRRSVIRIILCTIQQKRQLKLKLATLNTGNAPAVARNSKMKQAPLKLRM